MNLNFNKNSFIYSLFHIFMIKTNYASVNPIAAFDHYYINKLNYNSKAKKESKSPSTEL